MGIIPFVQMINIVLATDHKLLPHIGVVISSILSNTKSEVIFHVLTRGIHDPIYVKGIPVYQYPMDTFNYGRIKLARWVTMSTMDRLMLPKLLPKVGKVIYLDIDVVVMDDIAKLYAIETGECGIAARQSTRDGFLTNHDYARRTRVNVNNLQRVADKAPNFNAGVLVLDLNKMRENNASNIMLKIIRMTQCNDQIALASYSQGRFTRLEPRWNTWVGVDKDLDNPGILHYIGIKKPWDGNTELIEHWNKYATTH